MSNSNDNETLSLYLPRSILLKLLTLIFARFASSFCVPKLEMAGFVERFHSTQIKSLEFKEHHNKAENLTKIICCYENFYLLI